MITQTTRIKSHIKEEISQRAFEEFIHPWVNQGWNPKDYGIDTVVEVFSPIIGSNNFRPDSLFFLVQLKSTDKEKKTDGSVSISVPVHKVIDWYNSNVPLLFVVYHIDDKRFYTVWVDEDLILQLDKRNPLWTSNKTVSLSIGNDSAADSSFKERVKDYVSNWKSPIRKVLKPGQYFEFKQAVLDLSKEYESVSKSYAFSSVSENISQTQYQLDESLYRLSITGLSRSGKSSLVNGLLRSGNKEITPIGVFQTTGVPIEIIPSKEEKIEVFFPNNRKEEFELSQDIVREYASQENNFGNEKNVSKLTIHIKNAELEKGVSIYDIPGLDDPDDSIVDYTWITVRKSNAIVYVIDSAPAQHGGYIFKSEYKKHLLDLGSSLDRIFLVFNKVDVLDPVMLEKFKERVALDIERLGIHKAVKDRIYFLSTKKKSSKTIDSIEHLRADIWSYLLQENKTGLSMLSMLNRKLLQSMSNFETILNTRLIERKKVLELEDAILKTQIKTDKLHDRFYLRREIIKKQLEQSLSLRKSQLLEGLQNEFERVPIDKSLPNATATKGYLAQGISESLSNTNDEFQSAFVILNNEIDDWVDDNLEHFRELVLEDAEKRIIEFNELKDFQHPEIDLSSSIRMGLITAVLGWVIAPQVILAGGLIGFIGDLIFSAETNRQKRIKKIVMKATKKYDLVFKKMQIAYSDLVDAEMDKSLRYAANQVDLFLGDLKNAIGDFKEPLTDKQESVSYDTQIKIKGLKNAAIQNLETLNQYLQNNIHSDEAEQ
jgi:gas vesicle protein